MTRLLVCLISASFLFTAATCDKKEDTNAYQPGTPFQLKVGEKIYGADNAPDIQFVGIKEDSRCPKYSNCAWEGQAIATFMLMTKKPQTIELTAREGKPALASKAIDGFIYRLEAVDPYPESGQKINPDDYQVKLVVEKP
jgi:hypothetical protein